MIKKIIYLFLCLFVLESRMQAKDTLVFAFPNALWHKVQSHDGVGNKTCFVPNGHSAENYTEMLIFSEREVKNDGINALNMLQRQIGKAKANYNDIVPYYIVQEENNAMMYWCSKIGNTCAIQRVFKGNEGYIVATYINKMPHYSQNIFGQWPNILANIKVLDKTKEINPKIERYLIELD